MTGLSLRPVAALLLLGLAAGGCTLVPSTSATPIPGVVSSTRAGEMTLFVFTDQDGRTDLPERRGYDLRFPLVDARQPP
ncbi:conserved protein of unknown function [Rhodovastum atsumiense]|uniref:Uncharacterized protein n=1 Tax=Rhodovastum atsumiense TaxID=504468 RepID=A0A5M6IZJ8_9PROT|nr:hypothetical protein [Rhodovastum atsumiense]KAA5612778.1 hypothetical protein F1189_08565 [Rhodovastum atsumiense]CAH2602656.1 conserved protein of unknown function [Rhodovastum atsumiense]